VISELLDPTTVPDPLRGRFDPTAPVGVIGHSDGGVTAAAVAYNSTVADARVGAAVILSGAESMYPGSWFITQSPPLLAIHGDSDEINPYGASQQLYDDATGTKMLVTVEGGSHLGPFTTDPTEPAIAALAADFFHTQLEHDPTANDRITNDANSQNLTLTANA
jgi:predicted esterase